MVIKRASSRASRTATTPIKEVPFGPHIGKTIREKDERRAMPRHHALCAFLGKSRRGFPGPEFAERHHLDADSIEACDEDPCAVSRALQAKGIILKPFVIGIGLEDATKFSLKCVGNYYDAGTPEMFDRVLKVVIDQALNSTTTQLLLLTDDSKPTETDVPVTFYDQRTGGPLRLYTLP
ncbi:MAG: hypothetical protein IPO60_12220 [Flavobacteriales bacterium]|nr:hypothetical protein [Flavobacteriales bacterium]